MHVAHHKTLPPVWVLFMVTTVQNFRTGALLCYFRLSSDRMISSQILKTLNNSAVITTNRLKTGSRLGSSGATHAAPGKPPQGTAECNS